MMQNYKNLENLLRNKKILFSSAAAIGGVLSGAIMTSFFDVQNGFISWVFSGALDAAIIGALIVYAQNYYQTKSINITLGLKNAIKKGLFIGAIGGFIALLSMQIFGGGNFGRIMGWAISGGVAGFVVSSQVPNFKRSTAISAGAIGGFIGCLFMYMNFGYTIGVAITGAAIGLMVAIAEVLFRKNWIDIEIFSKELGPGLNLEKPIHKFTLNLGKNPITIGFNDNMDLKLKKPSVGVNQHFASIYIDYEKVFFHNLIANVKTELINGKPFLFSECKINLGR